MSGLAIDEQLLQELTLRNEPTLVPACRRFGARWMSLLVAAAAPAGTLARRRRTPRSRPPGATDEGVVQLIAAYRALLTPLAARTPGE